MNRGDDVFPPLPPRGGAIVFEERLRIPADGYRWSPVLGGGFLLTRDLNPVGGYAYKLLSR